MRNIINIKIIIFCSCVIIIGLSEFGFCNVNVKFEASLGDFVYQDGKIARVKPFNSVQGAPQPLRPPLVQEQFVHDADLTPQYRINGVTYVRIPQDDGFGKDGFSLASIFPDILADPDDPAAYNFKNIDKALLSIVDAGCSPLWEATYDIGDSDSWGTCCQKGRPPVDLAKWKKVVQRCLAHFNRGWADGHKLGISYVEFINEPCGLGGFDCVNMQGRERLAEAIKAFLEAIAEYNRNYQDSVKAVCCAEAGSDRSWDLSIEGVMKPVLKYIKSNNLGLDVFSYHHYGSADMIREDALKRKQVLVEEGFHGMPLWLTEWNADLYPPEVSGRLDLCIAFRGAHNTLVKITSQDVLDEAFLYRVNRPSGPMNAYVNHPRFPRYFDFSSGTALPDSFAWRFLKEISQQSPLRLKIKENNPSDMSLPKVLIAQSESGEKIAILVAYWKPQSPQWKKDKAAFTITLRNVPAGMYGIKRFIVDKDTRKLKASQASAVRLAKSGTMSIEGNMQVWSYQYYVIEKMRKGRTGE